MLVAIRCGLVRLTVAHRLDLNGYYYVGLHSSLYFWLQLAEATRFILTRLTHSHLTVILNVHISTDVSDVVIFSNQTAIESGEKLNAICTADSSLQMSKVTGQWSRCKHQRWDVQHLTKSTVRSSRCSTSNLWKKKLYVPIRHNRSGKTHSWRH